MIVAILSLSPMKTGPQSVLAIRSDIHVHIEIYQAKLGIIVTLPRLAIA